jgi:hypothetical protein
MAIAARKPQPSTPSDNISLLDVFDMEDVSFETHQRFSIAISDTISVEDISLLVGLSYYISIDDEITISNSLFHFYLINIEFSDTIDIDMYQNFTEQLKEVLESVPVDNSDAVARLDGLELDLALSSTNPTFFKEFTYSEESLTGYNVYTNPSKLVKLYSVVFSFSGENLFSKTITRLSDGKQLIIVFNYSDGNLVSQTRTLI